MIAFQCMHSGLYFPADYYKKWGITYGIGQGPDPVSEILNSIDHLPKAEAFQPGSEIFMHPMGVTHAPVQMVEIDEETFEKSKAIFHHEDRDLVKRTKIVIEKQKAKAKAFAEEIYQKSQELNK